MINFIKKTSKKVILLKIFFEIELKKSYFEIPLEIHNFFELN